MSTIVLIGGPEAGRRYPDVVALPSHVQVQTADASAFAVATKLPGPEVAPKVPLAVTTYQRVSSRYFPNDTADAFYAAPGIRPWVLSCNLPMAPGRSGFMRQAGHSRLAQFLRAVRLHALVPLVVWDEIDEPAYTRAMTMHTLREAKAIREAAQKVEKSHAANPRHSEVIQTRLTTPEGAPYMLFEWLAEGAQQ
jgi:hypothetical protein